MEKNRKHCQVYQSQQKQPQICERPTQAGKSNWIQMDFIKEHSFHSQLFQQNPKK